LYDDGSGGGGDKNNILQNVTKIISAQKVSESGYVMMPNLLVILQFVL
jgi:hypothetical protein